MGKIIDITGQRFGSLVAMYPSRINGRFAWHCKCDCGKELDVDSGNLRNGRTSSCGCQRANSVAQKLKKDIVGQKFNHLTVLSDSGKRKSSGIVWICQCDCGNITEVTTGNLKSNHIKTCGQCEFRNENIKKLDLRGQTFGKLTVIDLAYINKKRATVWKCKCSCGNECEALGWQLTSKKKLSCGCLKSQGEEKIIHLLQNNNIPFIYQKTFENCIFPDTKKKAVFDFYINNQYLLEFDGEQHFLEVGEGTGFYTDEEILNMKYRDAFKTKWCEENNIPLLRIPYTKLNTLTINDLLLEIK